MGEFLNLSVLVIAGLNGILTDLVLTVSPWASNQVLWCGCSMAFLANLSDKASLLLLRVSILSIQSEFSYDI